MGMLEGKVAIVTGAGGGLGECHAKLLAHEGASVVVNDLGGSRDGTGAGNDMADQVVADIKAAGGNAVAHYGNVTVEDDATGMVQTAIDNFGQLDFFIANAGILRDKSFKNMTQDMWDAVINVHLLGTYLTVKAAYNQMLIQESGGSIVVTSSIAGSVVVAGGAAASYTVSKHGVIGLAKHIAVDYGNYNIRANAIQPAGISDSNLSQHAAEDRERATTPAATLPRPKPWLPIRRAGQARQEYGATLTFLFSDDSGYITETALPVDGGYLAT